MESDMILCKCGKKFYSFELENHYKFCKELKKYFLYFDKESVRLLKQYTQQKENLFMLKFLLQQYNNIIDEKIQNSY